MGPIEVLVVGLPQSRLNGEVLAALQHVVDLEVVSIVDGLFITKGEDGNVEYTELDEFGADDGEMTGLARLVEEPNGLLIDEDVHAFAAAMQPGEVAAALVLEHTWSRSLRDAVTGAGGSVIAKIRVSGSVGDEVVDAIGREGLAMARNRSGRPGLIGTMARAAVGAGTARAAIGGDSDDGAAGEDDHVAREQAVVEQQTAIQAAYEARAQVADLDAQLSAHQPAPPEPPEPVFAEDVADKLTQLAELHKASIINDDEFAAAKAKLLA
ncbi:MAG: DUF6325 family protein [Actinomycetota bacterium]